MVLIMPPRRAFLLAALLAGCGGPDMSSRYGGEDGKKIADLVGDFDDLVGKPKQLEAAFVAGAAPKGAALKKYLGVQLTLVGTPKVAGDTGKATIAFERSASGEKLGEKTWEFAKVGGEWKIKDAPMP
jgi:hypothetical protein